jgi:hypothetical protein
LGAAVTRRREKLDITTERKESMDFDAITHSIHGMMN